MEYPKIETLFERDDRTHKVTSHLSLPEFAIPHRWDVTEKIDGINIRVILEPAMGQGESHPNRTRRPAEVRFGGRTDDAQLSTFLFDYLRETFPVDKVAGAFDEGSKVTLFGEGYGPKIGKGGGNYRTEGPSFRLFDVVVHAEERDWWLSRANVADVAKKLEIEVAPTLGSLDMKGVVEMVRGGLPSTIAILENEQAIKQGDIYAEGVVCRTDPLLFLRNGRPLMFKLKTKDFA